MLIKNSSMSSYVAFDRLQIILTKIESLSNRGATVEDIIYCIWIISVNAMRFRCNNLVTVGLTRTTKSVNSQNTHTHTHTRHHTENSDFLPGTRLANSTTLCTVGVMCAANCCHSHIFCCSSLSAVDDATSGLEHPWAGFTCKINTKLLVDTFVGRCVHIII